MRFNLLRRSIVTIIVILVASSALHQEVVAQDQQPEPTEGRECSDGRLRIRDLEDADRTVEDGLEQVQARAEEWQQDARLVELRLSCPLLMTGLQWEGTFFSGSAQAIFSTDTMNVEPVEEAPDEVPYLDVGGVTFQPVYRSLLRAGFAEDLKLASASSVTVRLSTDQIPFGPPTAPRGEIYVHVAVEERGVIKDVWINVEDGTIYRYDIEG